MSQRKSAMPKKKSNMFPETEAIRECTAMHNKCNWALDIEMQIMLC